MKLYVISVWAPDVAATANFYKDVLRVPFLGFHNGRPHFDLDGTYLVVLKGKPAPAADTVPERFPLFALEVGNLQVAVERLKRNGVALPWGIESDADNRWVMLYDPGGNLIELVER